jgi:hypothetical protein
MYNIIKSIDVSEEFCLLAASCRLPAWLTPQRYKWRRHIPPKRRLNLNELHGIISQKIETFITADVTISNPTLTRTRGVTRQKPVIFNGSDIRFSPVYRRLVVIFTFIFSISAAAVGIEHRYSNRQWTTLVFKAKEILLLNIQNIYIRQTVSEPRF